MSPAACAFGGCMRPSAIALTWRSPSDGGPTTSSDSGSCPTSRRRCASPPSSPTTCCSTTQAGALQDVVTCIRHNVTIDDLGDRRERHADRYLKAPEEMHRLFSRYPEALARTIAIMERCRFSLDELSYQYPEERDDPALSPQQTLEELTWAGAAE